MVGRCTLGTQRHLWLQAGGRVASSASGRVAGSAHGRVVGDDDGRERQVGAGLVGGGMQGAPLERGDGVEGLLVGHILAAEQFSQRVGRADHVTPTRGHLADEALERANNGHRHPGHVGAQPEHIVQEHPVACLPADATR